MWWWGAAGATEPVIGATLRPELWADTAREPATADQTQASTREDPAETALWGRLFGNGEFGTTGNRWFFEARFQHHVYVQELADRSRELEGWSELGLGDSGLDVKLAGPARVRVGALVARWGNMTLLPVTDVLNPRDLRNGLRTQAAFQKLPLPMATLVVASDHVRSELSLIPISGADRSWLRETDWSYVRQGGASGLLFEAAGDGVVQDADGDGVDDILPGWAVVDANGDPYGESASERQGIGQSLRDLSTRVDGLSPSLRRGLDAAINQKGLPEALLVNGEVAERLVFTASNLQAGLMGGYVRSRQAQSSIVPSLERLLRDEVLPGDLLLGDQDAREAALAPFQADTAADQFLKVRWPHTALAGADVTGLAGPIQLRAETMFRSAQVVRQRYGQSAVTPSLVAGGGADWIRSTTQVSLEARYTRLLDPPKELLFALPDQIQLAGGVRWVTLRDRLVLQAGGVFDASFGEGMFRPTVTWKPDDHVNVELGAMVIGGKTKAPDTLTDALVYRGGPLSYFQQNDEVMLAFEFLR